jgi:hypothetical protein
MNCPINGKVIFQIQQRFTIPWRAQVCIANPIAEPWVKRPDCAVQVFLCYGDVKFRPAYLCLTKPEGPASVDTHAAGGDPNWNVTKVGTQMHYLIFAKRKFCENLDNFRENYEIFVLKFSFSNFICFIFVKISNPF